MSSHPLLALASVAFLAGAASAQCLLIPDATSRTVGMYDPSDGTYLGVLIPNTGLFYTPFNAIVGPDGLIYVSDQVYDSVMRFDASGDYVDTFADSSDGMNSLRGITFYNGLLFVTSGDGYIAAFDGPHSRVPDFISGGCNPFDIQFVDDGDALVSDAEGFPDHVRRYDSNGDLEATLFSVNGPHQIQADTLAPGAFLNAAVAGDQITDFDASGDIAETWYFDGGRGVYRLGNGNLLVTASDGVWEYDETAGVLVENENPGASGYFIEYAVLGDPTPPGDVDGDGDIDQADLGALLAAYGATDGDPAYDEDADFDADGDVDQSDLGVLLGNYGYGT